VAITTTKQGILTLSGIKDLSDEIKTFDIIKTKVVANPIPMPLIDEVVTASVGHIPIRRTKVGFSFKRPLVNILILLIL
jgi:ribose/xylose/arabinose/galactoside ABC-type transport system permease subunit